MFTHVEVEMNLESDLRVKEDRQQLGNAVNHEVYNLCSFLATATTLKSLSIDVSCGLLKGESCSY